MEPRKGYGTFCGSRKEEVGLEGAGGGGGGRVQPRGGCWRPEGDFHRRQSWGAWREAGGEDRLRREIEADWGDGVPRATSREKSGWGPCVS